MCEQQLHNSVLWTVYPCRSRPCGADHRAAPRHRWKLGATLVRYVRAIDVVEKHGRNSTERNGQQSSRQCKQEYYPLTESDGLPVRHGFVGLSLDLASWRDVSGAERVQSDSRRHQQVQPLIASDAYRRCRLKIAHFPKIRYGSERKRVWLIHWERDSCIHRC